MNLSKYCITPSYSIKEALAQIEGNGNRAAVVLNKGKVVGLLSQGDVIRALIAGADLLSPIGQFASPSFLYLTERDMDEAVRVAKLKGATILPVLNEDFSLVDVVTLFDVLSYLEGNMR